MRPNANSFLLHFKNLIVAVLLLTSTAVYGNGSLFENLAANNVGFSLFENTFTPFSSRLDGLSIPVADVEDLYSKVNDPANVGATIVLAPNNYRLSAVGPSGPRPNGGRLELQENMSLRGSSNQAQDVVIDAGQLSPSSYQLPTLTAAIRIGKGSNSIESLTVKNAIYGTAAIGTDLNLNGSATVRIQNVIATGNARGIDVRNLGLSAVGRVVFVDIRDCIFSNNTLGAGTGIRFFNQASNGVIVARLKKNSSFGNNVGMIASNSTNSARISIELSGDKFDSNGTGAIILGGLSSSTAQANENTIRFTGHACSFSNNTIPVGDAVGGLLLFGGESALLPNRTSTNTVDVKMRGCKLEGNQVTDLGAFAARFLVSTTDVAGTNNVIKIDRKGPGNPSIVESFFDSIPISPSSGNVVIH